MSQRLEFVSLARKGLVNIAELCRRFGISRKTGYKWITRFEKEGAAGLHDRSRAPKHQPARTDALREKRVLQMREKRPGNGPRKVRRRLQNLGHTDVPSVSTVARILKRNGCIDPAAATAHKPCKRFERARANELWQMDFKGHFAMARGGRCHPLTLIDDHSRFLLGLRACTEETTTVVRAHLIDIFRRYGLPEEILCDNGPPWGGGGPELSALAVWLIRLGIRPIHGRPHHPQTQGKDERFHRTLKYELLCRADWLDLPQTQPRFDAYRHDYNNHRPHEALQLDCPVSRYQVSSRTFPEHLPVPEYDTGELVRMVKSKGEITVHNRFFYIGNAFIGLPVALRPCSNQGSRLRVCLGAIAFGLIDPNHPIDRPKGNYYPMTPLTEKL